jgi:hypothetical protein
MSSKPIYLNPKQLAFIENNARRKVFIGGRGTGKTTVGGVQQYLYSVKMPRSKGFILGLTYNQILTKFLPPMLEMIERMGMREHKDRKSPGHFVVGKKPPDNWQKPYSAPRNWENTITFFTGRCIELLSFDRRDTTRGGSYDDGWFDEAVLIDKFRHDKEILPMIRGNDYRFQGNPYHGQRSYVSSQAWLPSGFWVPDMAELVDPSNPDDTFFIESTTHDNVHVLGKRYLRDLERDLPYWTYQVEIMNRKVNKLPNCFYNALDETRHLYYNSYQYGNDPLTGAVISTGDSDYDPKLPIEVSFDFGGSICSMTIHQATIESGRIVERTINKFYQKNGLADTESTSLLTRLLNQFIERYRGHQNILKIWGDRNGHNKQPNSARTMYEEIRQTLTSHKFNCEMKVKGLDPLHQVKHYAINEILSENNPKLPLVRINQNTCKDLIISMQSAPITQDFKKDKSSERDASVPAEHATHLSDCFDNYIFPKYAHLFGRARSEKPIEAMTI